MGFAFVLITATAYAQTTLQLDPPRRFATFTSSKPPTVPPKIDDHEGASAVLTVPASGNLYVWDRESGNLAQKPVGQVGKALKLAAKDFAAIGLATVRVEHAGQPVAAARVSLKDKAGERSQILDPSSNGEAPFYVVQPGRVTVTVEYRSGGQPAPPVIQLFDLQLERRTADPVLTISLPNPVETLGAVDRTASTPTAPPPQKHRSPVGSFIVYVIALAAAAGLGYYVYQIARKHPKWVEERLKTFGVTVQDSQPSPDPVAVPDAEPPVKPAPSKIILDDPGPASSGPRLVGPSGLHELPEGESLVGREAGLPLSFPAESSVSRRHASIKRSGSQLTVQDLGSTNGTFVNGRRIDSETILRPGDDVQFGAVKFRVEG